jgi:3-oxoacyl-[acyl-carrier protein] reductase
MKGRVALVVGGSRGIGRATALELARRGATVAVSYAHDRDAARETLRLAGGGGLALRADLARSADAARLVRETVRRFGRLDVLVASAGHSDARLWNQPPERVSEAAWRRIVEVELNGPFWCARAAAPVMRRRGGAMVFVSSSAAIQGDATTLAYAGAKTGILGLVRALAWALAPRVRVNAVAPGSIATSWLRDWKLRPSELREIRRLTALRRIGRAEEVATAIRFLASDEASFVTGQTLIVDGGVLMA